MSNSQDATRSVINTALWVLTLAGKVLFDFFVVLQPLAHGPATKLLTALDGEAPWTMWAQNIITAFSLWVAAAFLVFYDTGAWQQVTQGQRGAAAHPMPDAPSHAGLSPARCVAQASSSSWWQPRTAHCCWACIAALGTSSECWLSCMWHLLTGCGGRKGSWRLAACAAIDWCLSASAHISLARRTWYDLVWAFPRLSRKFSEHMLPEGGSSSSSGSKQQQHVSSPQRPGFNAVEGLSTAAADQGSNCMWSGADALVSPIAPAEAAGPLKALMQVGH
jgi:hypothetical protein